MQLRQTMFVVTRFIGLAPQVHLENRIKCQTIRTIWSTIYNPVRNDSLKHGKRKSQTKMRFSLRSLMYLTTVIAIQLAIPMHHIPTAILVCSGLIFAFFIMSVFACVFTSEQNGPTTFANNRRLTILLRGLGFTLICFWALFFNSMIRGMFT